MRIYWYKRKLAVSWKIYVTGPPKQDAVWWGMKSKKRNEDARHRKDYLDGLKRFKKRGIPIIIDGKECREADWTRIFDVGEDGAFYMGDYVCSDKGGLKEIRFDKVYLSEDQKKKRK